MAHVTYDLETTTPADMVLAALTDFTPRRPALWPDLSPEYYEVYDVGATSADVREGTGPPFSIWAREHYDWSTPGTVSWGAVESNFCAPGSGLTITVTPTDGGSRVHADWHRTPTTLKGRVIVAMVTVSKGRVLSRRMQQSLDALPGKLAATDS